ncbi:MAG TPA: T9SS type A sorting domain-containing protein, partial [Bacteroidota bacterium]|nr:T9SS type A sorting domain-containing protein [Bacteroidota bacterium]
EAIDFPVRISAASSPVALGWHISESATTEYSLVVTNKQTGKTNTRLMTGEGNVILWNPDISEVKIHVSGNLAPSQFALHQNYPNPFNPSTVIRYQLPVNSYVTLKVFDLIGKEVKRLFDGVQEAGYYTVPFVADHLANGVYFYQLTARQIPTRMDRGNGQAGTFTSVQKMLVLK